MNKIFKRIFISFMALLGLSYIISGIYFFRKTSYTPSVQKEAMPDTSNENSTVAVLKEIEYDFEGDDKRENISYEKFYSCKKSCKFTPSTEYGCNILQTLQEFPGLNKLQYVEISYRLWNSNKLNDAAWVLELNGKDGSVIQWSGNNISEESHNWKLFTFRFEIKADVLKNLYRLKLYIWNKNKNTFYVDDVKVSFYGVSSAKELFVAPLKNTSFLFDLENDSLLDNTGSLSDDYAHSGKWSSYMNGKNENSAWICKTAESVMNDSLRFVNASVWLYPLSDDCECTFVFEVRNEDDEQVYWNGKNTKTIKFKKDLWQKLNAGFNIGPEDYYKFKPHDRLCIYIQDNSRTKLYADDFEISYGDIPARRGEEIYVDMNAVYGGSYTFNRNHPPYPVSDLQYKDIHNSNSAYLIDYNSIHDGMLKPDQYIFSGNFTTKNNGQDEILSLNNNSIEIYKLNDNDERFNLVARTPFDGSINSNSTFLTGDFNGDGIDEFLTTTNFNSVLYKFQVSHSSSSGNPGSKQLIESWNGKLYKTDQKIYTGRFSGGVTDEILISDKSGYCSILKYTNNQWIIVAEDSIPPSVFGDKSTQVCGKFTTTSTEEMLSVYFDKGTIHYSLIRQLGKKIKATQISSEKMTANVFSFYDKLFRIHRDENRSDQILAFNTQWRFELKLINSDKDGFYISSVPEFSGYISDRNPKYYEFPKLIPGRFSKNQWGVLCILRNCKDADFDGRNCKQYDSIPDLPNTIQLYNFPK